MSELPGYDGEVPLDGSATASRADAEPRPEPGTEPGTEGERHLQRQYGTEERATRFYRDQLLDRLTPRMREFLGEQTEMVVASADPDGRPDASVRFGEPGFVAVLDERTVAWPELRGNGVLTTLGNLVKNPAAHLMFLDRRERIGLHLRGEAHVVEPDLMAAEHPELTERDWPGRAPERWVVLRLESSYIHCRKHFPHADAPVEWGTDDVKAKGGDYFGAKDVSTPWSDQPGDPGDPGDHRDPDDGAG